jgi:hypothetical protein
MSRPRIRRKATKPLPARAVIRLLLLPDCRDADGEARPGLLVPGRRLPLIFGSIGAALAAKQRLEAGADA